MFRICLTRLYKVYFPQNTRNIFFLTVQCEVSMQLAFNSQFIVQEMDIEAFMFQNSKEFISKIGVRHLSISFHSRCLLFWQVSCLLRLALLQFLRMSGEAATNPHQNFRSRQQEVARFIAVGNAIAHALY